jgi:hypothetical protein
MHRGGIDDHLATTSGIEDLRGMTEAELIKAHDETTSNRALPATYYLDELRRREAEHAEAAAYKLASASHDLASVYSLTIINTALAGLAAVVAIAAQFLR